MPVRPHSWLVSLPIFYFYQYFYFSQHHSSSNVLLSRSLYWFSPVKGFICTQLRSISASCQRPVSIPSHEVPQGLGWSDSAGVSCGSQYHAWPVRDALVRSDSEWGCQKKEVKGKIHFIKIKNCCASKNILKKVKRPPTEWKRLFLQMIYLIRV